MLRVSDASGRARAVVAELVGTAFLLAAVVGSGIMGERLSGGTWRLRSLPTPSRPGPRSSL
jgi:hypothetical protein